VAGNRRPGPECASGNQQNVDDGTLCLQVTPKPGPTGARHDNESAAEGAYQALVNQSAILIHRGMSILDLERAVVEKYGREAIAAAEKNLQQLIEKIKGAADWESLNRLAAPALGPLSFNAGLLAGLGESLVGDAAALLGLGKMIVLAGIYQRMKSPVLLLGTDPLTLVFVFAARHIPWLAAQSKSAHDQLRQILEELRAIAKHPLDFIEAVGSHVWKGAEEDWNKLKGYGAKPTVSNDFQAGRITGHALYQVVSAILLVLSVAGAAAKIASRFPGLVRLARIISRGGALEDLQGVRRLEQAGGAAETAGEAAKAPAAAKPVAAASNSVTRTYGKNTATWVQDANGRTVHVDAQLRESFTGLNRSSAETKAQKAAAALGEEGDAGGHMVGHRFLGDQGDINLFPQEKNFNNSAYKTMENELADWTKQGKEVKLKIDLDPPGADRPDVVRVKYDVIDPATGEVSYSNAQKFRNDVGQTFDRIPASDMPNY
jgi:hypothetical protein